MSFKNNHVIIFLLFCFSIIFLVYNWFNFSINKDGEDKRISIFDLAKDYNFIFSEFNQEEFKTNLYIYVHNTDQIVKIGEFSDERAIEFKSAPQNDKIALVINEFINGNGKLILVNDYDYSDPITVAEGRIVSFCWGDNGQKIFFVLDENDYVNNDPYEPLILAEKYKIKAYDIPSGQIGDVANYKDITGVERANFLEISEEGDNNLYLYSWGEDSVFNIRIWKYNYANGVIWKIADFQEYQNEKYKKSQLIGFRQNNSEFVFEAGLNNAGDEELLALYSFSENEVEEIAKIGSGYQAMLSPDENKIIFNKTENLEIGSFFDSIMVYDFSRDEIKDLYTNSDGNKSLYLVKWLPDSKSFLFSINEDYQLVNTELGKITEIEAPDNLKMYNIHGWY